jgi:aryl-alcohol dehydrogenase (NADP+)
MEFHALPNLGTSGGLRLTEGELRRLSEVSRPRVGVYPYGPLAQEQRSRKLLGSR